MLFFYFNNLKKKRTLKKKNVLMRFVGLDSLKKFIIFLINF